jgi:4-alpha-glucanotransferase
MTGVPDGPSGLDDAARAAGLVWRYRDGAGRMQEAPSESRAAVLAALGHANPAGAVPETLRQSTSLALIAGQRRDWGPDPWVLTLESGEELRGEGALPALPVGYHRILHRGWTVHLLSAPPRLPAPPRLWGVTAPLFALWGADQSGMGLYPMLGDLAQGLAGHGAAFLGINPIHAGFPCDPLNFSPYAPSHRRRLNVLHVDTAAKLPPTGPLIDHAATIPAQRAALSAAHAAWPGDPAFDDWRAAQGEALVEFTIHQALSDRFGAYWCDWPLPYQDPKSQSVQDFADASSDALSFHAWAQWMAERQLADSQTRARSAGMALGLYLDLAVGTHPYGAETWAEREGFAHGISLGAPPDLLGPSGQRWGLAPLRPDLLRATGHKALRETLRAQLRHCGLLRLDHILGFERSFWVPEGLPGLYVQMPRDEMLAVLRIEAARANGGAGAVIVGEDLGTIPEGLRAALADSGVLGCRVAVFERDWNGDGAFLPPDSYSPGALASWGTHDTPTWAGWRAGRDLDWRARLGELPNLPATQDQRRAEVAIFDAVAGPTLTDMHRHLAATPCALVAVQAEDLTGAVEQANLPGTIFEHPNWRRRLALPVPALTQTPTLTVTAAIMAQADRNHRTDA